MQRSYRMFFNTRWAWNNKAYFWRVGNLTMEKARLHYVWSRRRGREQKRKWKGNAEQGRHTKANRELNSPATVQAALVIPWEAWAEDDATELCHRATTLSWGRPTEEKKTCHLSTELLSRKIKCVRVSFCMCGFQDRYSCCVSMQKRRSTNRVCVPLPHKLIKHAF